MALPPLLPEDQAAVAAKPAKKKAAKAPAPVAQKWYFNGRVYYSYAAYAKAVAAAQTAKATKASSLSASRTAAQRKLLLARQATITAASRARLARDTAAAAARRQLGGQAARESERQYAEDRARTLAEQARKRANATDRHNAYDALQERYRALLHPAAVEKDRERRLREADSRQSDVGRLVGENISEGHVRRSNMLKAAERVGDYEHIFRYIADQQSRTGGRYVDDELYRQASEKSIRLIEDVRKERDAFAERIYKAFDAENWTRVLELVDSPDWQAVEARFKHYYGDGRQGGAAQRMAMVQQQIATERDRWLTSQLVGSNDRAAVSSAQAEADYERFVRENLRGDVNPRSIGGRMGTGVTHAKTLPQWLDEQDAKARLQQAATIEGYRNEWARTHQHLVGRGMGEIGEYALKNVDGETGLVNLNLKYKELASLYTGQGVLSQEEFDKLLNDLYNGVESDRNRALERLMQTGMQAYQKRDGEAWQRQDGRDPFLRRWVLNDRLEGEENARKRLELLLTGQVNEGLGGELSRLNLNPFLDATVGNAVEGWERLLGGTTSAVRLLTMAGTGGGNLALPDIQFDALFGSGNPFISTKATESGFDTSDEAKAKNAQELRDLMSVIGDPNTDLGRRLDAIRTFGQGFSSGNTSMLAESLVDPFSFVGAGRFLRGGRLAVAEAGGLRAALARPGASVGDFLKHSLPERIGGLSSGDLEILTERLRLSRKSGVPYAEVKAMTDDEIAALADETLRKSAEEAAKSGPWQQHFEANPVQAQQLFSAVAEQAAELAGKGGVRRITSAGLQQDIDYARRAAAEAVAQERQIAARAQRLAAETQGAKALEGIRAERARKGLAPVVGRQVSSLTPALKGQRTRLARQYEKLVTERVTVAREAEAAMKLVEGARDTGFRQIYFKRLDEAVERLRLLDDDVTVDPLTGAHTPVEGEIHRAKAHIESFDRLNKTGDKAEPFIGVTMPRVNQDVRYVQGEIVAARASLKAASSPTQIRYWTNRLKRLGESKDYLDVERRDLRGAKVTARRSMRKYATQAAHAINLNKIAARAVTAATGREALIRDIRRRGYGSTVDVVYQAPSPQAAAEIVAVSKGLGRSSVSKATFDRLTDLKSQFGDVDFLDLGYALWEGKAKGFLGRDADDLWDAFSNDVREALAAARKTRVDRIASADVDVFMDAYRADQLLSGGTFTMRQYRHLDDGVSAAIRDARGYAATGQVQVRKAKTGAASSFVKHDNQLTEMYAKLSALKRDGVSVAQYDETRTVLGDVNLRLNRGTTLRRRSQSISRATGKPIDEVFDQLREKARLDEVANNLEYLAYRMPGLSEDELFSVFELQMIQTDLAPFSKRPLTSYQADTLQKAYGDLTGGADIADNAVADTVLGRGASEHPDFDKPDRGAMHEWMTDNGHFSPRAADEIRAGNRVYGVEAERDFWESGFGFTPPWTKEEIMVPLLRNKDAYDAQMREWGVFNSDFEKIMAAQNLTGTKLRDSMVFGGEGIERARTWEELRTWAIQRYGSWVEGRYGPERSAHHHVPNWIGWHSQRNVKAGADPDLMSSASRATPEMRARVRAGEMPTLRVRRQAYVAENGAEVAETQRWLLVDRDDMKWVDAALAEDVRDVPIQFTEKLLPHEIQKQSVGLVEMPWLMNLKEYDDWVGRSVFDEPLMKASGIEFDPKMVRAGERTRFAEAVSRATEKSFERAQKQGEFDGAWLPQEQNRFIMDVVDHLMTDPNWRRFFAKKPAGARLLDNIGSFWRAAMTWTISFPFMNLLDTVGLKRGILAATQNGFRPLSRVSDAALAAIPSADTLGSRAATWYVKGRNGFVNSLDSDLSKWMRLREAGRGITELPVRVSKFGEDRLRLDFGRAMFDGHYQNLLERGVSAESAKVRALAFAQSKVDDFFPDLSKAGGFERTLNQLVPFFSYNLRLKVMGVKLALENPWLLTMGERMGDFIEDQNRGIWEMENPGVPFPENDPSSRRLQIKVGDTVYVIDLGSMSDLTRGLSVFHDAQGKSVVDMAYEFFRVPHPSQAIFLAVAFGFNDGLTPWGTKATWEDVSTWFDFAGWLRDGGSKAFDPNDPRSRDAIQIFSQMLFFKEFGRISPMKAKVQQFFGFMALDEDRAWEYYNDNEDLQAYFALNGTSYRIEPGEKARRLPWAMVGDKDAYDEAFAGLRDLRARFDQKLDEFYLTPWDPAYREWKRRRRGVITAYLRDNPILADVWGFEMEPSEMADLREDWLVDEQMDHYFGLDSTKPLRDAFDEGTAGELAFQREMSVWYDQRADWIEAHPAVYDRLHQARNEVEQAWFEQELQWSEILDRNADVRIQQLELELHLEGDPDDVEARALLNALHELTESNFARLDAESFGQFYDLLRVGGKNLRPLGFPNQLLDRVKTMVVFPGRADRKYAEATPAEQRQIRVDERYAAGFDQLWKTIGDDVTRFYDQLKSDPWLMREYFARNPEKEAAYLTGNEYRGWMGRWVGALQKDDFTSAQSIWDSMPAWVHERYFAKHPDSKMRDGMGGGAAFTDGQGNFFKSADSMQRFLSGQAYFASMQTWVNMLRERDYVGADKFFATMPAWMREKYFDKHPDQRAKFELDSMALRKGANYFLATDDPTKLALLQRNPDLRAWLAANGGSEAAMRGLIQAIYRGIPSNESWLKRTFRERYPEIFSAEAAAQRRLASVARDLAENPEMRPFYDRALALQTHDYRENLKHEKRPPTPLVMERKRRLRKRTKRRAARFNSRWAMHYEARRGIRNSAGS